MHFFGYRHKLWSLASGLTVLHNRPLICCHKFWPSSAYIPRYCPTIWDYPLESGSLCTTDQQIAAKQYGKQPSHYYYVSYCNVKLTGLLAFIAIKDFAIQKCSGTQNACACTFNTVAKSTVHMWVGCLHGHFQAIQQLALTLFSDEMIDVISETLSCS